MNNIGNRIYELRLKNKMSQEALADALNVSRQAISKWENSMSIPEIEKIIQMSEIFVVSTDYLLKGEDESLAKDNITRETIIVEREAQGFTKAKLQQMIGLMFIGIGIVGILVGALTSYRVLVFIAPLLIVFGFMLVYIKEYAYIWCLGVLTVLTFILGRYFLHPTVFLILLITEVMTLAGIISHNLKK